MARSLRDMLFISGCLIIISGTIGAAQVLFQAEASTISVNVAPRRCDSGRLTVFINNDTSAMLFDMYDAFAATYTYSDLLDKDIVVTQTLKDPNSTIEMTAQLICMSNNWTVYSASSFQPGIYHFGVANLVIGYDQFVTVTFVYSSHYIASHSDEGSNAGSPPIGAFITVCVIAALLLMCLLIGIGWTCHSKNRRVAAAGGFSNLERSIATNDNGQLKMKTIDQEEIGAFQPPHQPHYSIDPTATTRSSVNEIYMAPRQSEIMTTCMDEANSTYDCVPQSTHQPAAKVLRGHSLPAAEMSHYMPPNTTTLPRRKEPEGSKVMTKLKQVVGRRTTDKKMNPPPPVNKDYKDDPVYEDV